MTELFSIPDIPLPEWQRGDQVCWTERKYGASSGLSHVHRLLENGQTYCWQKIPTDPKRIVDLALLRVQECERCNEMFAAGVTPAEAIAMAVSGVMEQVA